VSENVLIVVVTCAGVLLVILNKPLGDAAHDMDLGLGGDTRFYRWLFVFIGLVLVLMSFLYER
jgi:hypothetical protein